ncbi:hypothetical protein AB0I72_25325 [Nocardiopsis sp. NPDC049922]|uniref:hypothetical protein n=1 Tax=Nocardiopsis sp. NPDC049922 TaxID=3155157 RepID=UPI0033D99C87
MRYRPPPRRWMLVTLAVCFVVQLILVPFGVYILVTTGRWSSLAMAAAWTVTLPVLIVQQRRAYIENQRTSSEEQ